VFSNEPDISVHAQIFEALTSVMNDKNLVMMVVVTNRQELNSIHI
jgi:hypothetical protein